MHKFKYINIYLLCVLIFFGATSNNLYANTNEEKELFLVAQKAFDDGFYDFYHYVFPILKKLKIKALLAIPT